jgi:hypothetical protein
MSDEVLIHLALPKGHMNEGVSKLLEEAGIKVRRGTAPGSATAAALCERRAQRPRLPGLLIDAVIHSICYRGAMGAVSGRRCGSRGYPRDRSPSCVIVLAFGGENVARCGFLVLCGTSYSILLTFFGGLGTPRRRSIRRSTSAARAIRRSSRRRNRIAAAPFCRTRKRPRCSRMRAL